MDNSQTTKALMIRKQRQLLRERAIKAGNEGDGAVVIEAEETPKKKAAKKTATPSRKARATPSREAGITTPARKKRTATTTPRSRSTRSVTKSRRTLTVDDIPTMSGDDLIHFLSSTSIEDMEYGRVRQALCGLFNAGILANTKNQTNGKKISFECLHALALQVEANSESWETIADEYESVEDLAGDFIENIKSIFSTRGMSN